MTTTDGFEAALDAYGWERQVLGMWGERNPLDQRYQRQRERCKSARAAVVALAPDRGRLEALEEVADAARYALAEGPYFKARVRLNAALRALGDAEPEDAGAGGPV